MKQIIFILVIGIVSFFTFKAFAQTAVVCTPDCSVCTMTGQDGVSANFTADSLNAQIQRVSNDRNAHAIAVQNDDDERANLLGLQTALSKCQGNATGTGTGTL